MTSAATTTLPSPVGPLRLTAVDGRLTELSMLGQAHVPPAVPGAREDPGAFRDVSGQLAAYFAGELTEFDVPLALTGTAFQVAVWEGLRAIPYGHTWSYALLAGKVGRPGAYRAVGLANGRNPVAIIVPCHRVIGANGSLTGYGGGLERKEWLLGLERRVRSARGAAGAAWRAAPLRGSAVG
jgi:methylated-DNA-[protein]-cysteine S-methyltransferase